MNTIFVEISNKPLQFSLMCGILLATIMRFSEGVGANPLFLRNIADWPQIPASLCVKGVILLSKEIESKVETLALPICKEFGLNLWAVEFVKEGSNWFLRVLIDRDGGVTIDDCENVSRKLDKQLDTHDFIAQAYMLEVGSAGIDRPLKRPEDFEKYTGEYVDIKLYKAINKVKQFQGKLRGLENSIISIETDDGETLSFELASVASCRLAVIF